MSQLRLESRMHMVMRTTLIPHGILPKWQLLMLFHSTTVLQTIENNSKKKKNSFTHLLIFRCDRTKCHFQWTIRSLSSLFCVIWIGCDHCIILSIAHKCHRPIFDKTHVIFDKHALPPIATRFHSINTMDSWTFHHFALTLCLNFQTQFSVLLTFRKRMNEQKKKKKTTTTSQSLRLDGQTMGMICFTNFAQFVWPELYFVKWHCWDEFGFFVVVGWFNSSLVDDSSSFEIVGIFLCQNHQSAKKKTQWNQRWQYRTHQIGK